MQVPVPQSTSGAAHVGVHTKPASEGVQRGVAPVHALAQLPQWSGVSKGGVQASASMVASPGATLASASVAVPSETPDASEASGFCVVPSGAESPPPEPDSDWKGEPSGLPGEPSASDPVDASDTPASASRAMASVGSPAQTPARQPSPARHGCPQEPQCTASLERSTHSEPQAERPVLQAPPTMASSCPQEAIPMAARTMHAVASEVRLTAAPLQRATATA